MKRVLILLFILTNALFFRGTHAEIDVYGKFNLGIWYFSLERFYGDTNLNTNDTIPQKDSFNLIISNWIPYGTFGLKYKVDRFSGCIEMGVRKNMYDLKMWGEDFPPFSQKKISDFITMKKWFAEWYINDFFTFLFGKSIAPTNFSPSNQIFWAGYGFNNAGCLSTGSYPMLQLTFKSPQNYLFTSEIKVAAIKIDTSVIEIHNILAAEYSYRCETKMPKLEGGFKYNIEKGIFSTYGNFAGGFQKYNVVLFQSGQNLSKKECYLEIPSYVIGTDLGLKVGMVSLAVDAFYGRNIGIYGAFVGDEFGWWRSTDYMSLFFPAQSINPPSTDWTFFNGTAYAIAGVLSVKPNQSLIFEGGIGYVNGKHEFNYLNKKFHSTIAWYFQSELTLFKLLKITPEIGQYDYGPQLGFGRYFYWGLNTGIDF